MLSNNSRHHHHNAKPCRMDAFHRQTITVSVDTLSNFIDFCNCRTSGRRFPFSRPETIRLFAKFFSALRFEDEAMPWDPELLRSQEQQQSTAA